MEKFSEILDDLKNRFSSRFVIYFTIYWFIFHWPITIALFWYDNTQIEAEGCKSIYEFIKDQLINNDHWLKTLWFAAGSTIAFPIIKTLILALDAWVIVRRNNWISKIKKDELLERNIRLEKEINSISDLSILNGTWKFTKKDFVMNNIYGEKTTIVNPIEITIRDGKYFEGINQTHVIDKFIYNPRDKQMIFYRSKLKNLKEETIQTFQSSNFMCELSFNDNDKNLLSGEEDGTQVEYERIK